MGSGIHTTRYIRLGKLLKLSVLVIVITVSILCLKYVTDLYKNYYALNGYNIPFAKSYENPYFYNNSLKTTNSDKFNIFKRPKYYTINYFKRNFYKEFLTSDQLKYLKEKYPGKYGKPVIIPRSNNSFDHYWLEYHKYEFDVLASDQIPLNRELPNKLMPKCYNLKYPLNLPNASIIIIFHNEANSTLLRTIHSAYTRSPLYLVEEIILVDDASDLNIYPHLGDQLLSYISIYPNVKLIRQPIRIGLTKAKIIGSQAAKGQVLVFLDSHCECWDGWLEPLLYSIHLNKNIAITPVIDVIKYQDFSVNSNIIDYSNVGIFNFKLDFKWKSVKMPPNMILKSPTMAGGLFAIDRDSFFKYGAYDDGMGFWGGENLEMSFRLWTCAEGIYIHHCSVVGHVFRDKSPHSLPRNSVLINKIRVAEVWLDEYKPAFYEYYSNIRNIDYGNISSRMKLRKNLNCKSFSWYLDNIATMVQKPDINPYSYGSVTNAKYPSLCFDSFGVVGNLRLIHCHNQGGNQNFIFNHNNEIRSGDFCLDSIHDKIGQKVSIEKCHNQYGNQRWFHRKNGLISRTNSFMQLCLEINNPTINDAMATLSICDRNNPHQIWSFSNYNPEISN